MRKEYRAAVRAAFRRGIDEVAPGLRSVKVKSPLLFSGETVFEWAPCDGFRGYLILNPSPQGRQEFTVEIGWSARGRFPETSSRPSLMLTEEDPDPVALEEGIVRIGGLESRNDVWWGLPDPALESPGSLDALQKSMEPIPAERAAADAEGPVAEALAAVARTALPFLDALARERCPGAPSLGTD